MPRTRSVGIRDLDEHTARALQIIENLHREDVTPLDGARVFDRLRGEDRTIEDVAALVGHSARYVAQRLFLVSLVPRRAQSAAAGDDPSRERLCTDPGPSKCIHLSGLPGCGAISQVRPAAVAMA